MFMRTAKILRDDRSPANTTVQKVESGAFTDQRQSMAAQLQQQQMMASANQRIQFKLNHQTLPPSPIVQRAKLGTGGLMSARELVKWYFSGGRGKQSKGLALAEIYQQIGLEAGQISTRRTEATLLNDEKIDGDDVRDLNACVKAYLDDGGVEALPPERKVMPANTWRHIWRGDFNGDKKKVTGYHWKGRGDNAWHEGFGDAANTTKGFYQQTVRVRADKVDDIVAASGATRGQVTGKVKDDASTFFPDAWNETQVKDAIELRDGQGKITTADADGISLVKSGTTIYPKIG